MEGKDRLKIIYLGEKNEISKKIFMANNKYLWI